MLYWHPRPEWLTEYVLLMQAIVLLLAYLHGQKAGWLLGLTVIGVLGMWAWFQALRRSRAILDTPTSRVGSAAQGYVELEGKGWPLPEVRLSSPMTDLPCLWYRYALYRRVNDRWQLEDEGQSDLPFLLDDGTGVCEIDPVGAEIRSSRVEKRQVGDRRYVEALLLEGERLYVLGQFRTVSGAHHTLHQGESLDRLLSEWKRDPVSLHTRFDLDGDGNISQAEWRQAVQAAREEVLRRHREIRQQPATHYLGKPPRGRVYLISNLDPQGLGLTYSRLAWLHMGSTVAALLGIGWAMRLPG